MLFVGASVGNIIGPHLFQTDEAPRYSRGLRSNLALFVALMVLILVGMAWIWTLNRKHAATRKALGKAEHIVDLSMEDKKTILQKEEAVNQGDERVGDKAFEDMTDLKNEDFIYVY